MWWVEFKDHQRPRIGETIVVKGPSGIYPHVLKVTKHGHYVKLCDDSTRLSIHGLTHWMLLKTPY